MLTTSTGMVARAGLLKPPGRWLLSHGHSYTNYDLSAGATAVDEDAAWAGPHHVAEDLNGAGVGGAAPTLVPTLDLLEAAERRLALAKLSHPRLGPAALSWDPDAEKMTGLLVVGASLYPWPDVEDDSSDDAEADEVEPALRTCVHQARVGSDSLNAEADVRNARMKLRNPCRCYRCLMQQLAVAIDLGPKFTGVAFSNHETVAIFPSAVAQEPPQPETPADSEPEPEGETREVSSVSEGVPGLGSEPVVVVGDAALALPSVRRPLGALAQPSKGVAMDWSALEAVWRHSYTHVLCVDPRDHALVMTEPSVNPKATRERLTTLAFTTFRVPSFYLLNSTSKCVWCLRVQHMRVGLASSSLFTCLLSSFAAATLYASGQTTGAVVHIDSAGITVSAIYEGYLLPHTTKTGDIGGDAIGQVLAPALERAGCIFTNPIMKMDCISDLVKAMAVVPGKSDSTSDTAASLPLESWFEVRRGLNGGLIRVKVTPAERLACGEALFTPSTVEPGRPQRAGGLADTLFSSLDAIATTDE